MADPLGFRSTAQHYIGKIVPGFSSRVRNRGWYAVLCWGAWQLEEKGYQQSGRSDPSTGRDERRLRLRYLSRALRIAHAVENPEVAKQEWAYGNSVAWWKDHRDQSTNYLTLNASPFHGNLSGEIANGALGCLRRSLERLNLFVPSEERLRQERDPLVDKDRSCQATDRGKVLAEAFHRDLDHLGLVTIAKEWGLWPDHVSDFRDEERRKRGLKRLAAAVPFRPGGAFDRQRFRKSWAVMDQTWHLSVDPLLDVSTGFGPWGATDRWLRSRSTDEEYPIPVGDDPWTTRLRLAVEGLRCLSGPTSQELPLFVVLGRMFVEEMQRLLPNGALEMVVRPEQHAPIGGALATIYRSARDNWKRADDALVAWERSHAAEMGWCPQAERQEGSGYAAFRRWVDSHERPSVVDLLELHRELPRFQWGATRPLFDLDGDRLYLDATFPWSEVEANEPEHKNDTIADDDGGDADAAPFLDDRTLQTWFWYAVDRAHAVLTEGQR